MLVTTHRLDLSELIEQTICLSEISIVNDPRLNNPIGLFKGI